MSWAHAPVAGRRACRGSSPIAGTCREAPPRSAVAVSPPAPALTRLTGFSRSGRSSSLCLLPLAGEAPLRPSGLARVLRLSVYNRWITGVLSVCADGTSVRASAAGNVSQTLRPLRVQRLGEAEALASGQDHLSPLLPEHLTKGRDRRGAR